MRKETGDAHISQTAEFIDYTDGEQVFEAYVSIPNGITRKSATVLLAHEWSGLNEGMRSVANRIAGIGYVCFAMDVYGKGVRGDQAGDNSHLMMPLIRNRPLLRQRLLAGLRAAVQHPSVDPSRIAALGYCFGGLCALDLARAVPPELRSVVTFHAALSPSGIHPQKPIKARILMYTVGKIVSRLPMMCWRSPGNSPRLKLIGNFIATAMPCMRSLLRGSICPTEALRTTRMPAAARGMPCAPSSPKRLNDNPPDWPV